MSAATSSVSARKATESKENLKCATLRRTKFVAEELVLVPVLVLVLVLAPLLILALGWRVDR